MQAATTTTSEPSISQIREVMKRPALENSLGLPEPLVRALQNDEYVRGDADFTVTELNLPPKIAALKRKHAHQIVEDAADRIFSLFGKAIHKILEESATDRYIVEERFTITHQDGTKVSGQIDLYDKETKTLQDWKITSRWVAADGIKPEWEQQQNLNRYLLTLNGLEVRKCQNVLIYRDWSKLMAARQRDYPQRQVEILDIPLWSVGEVQSYLEERITLHRAARSGEMPLCSPRERWTRPDRWALMKRGVKKAIKLYDTEDQAEAAVHNAGAGYYLQSRPGENPRCQYYCECLPFCAQGRELVRETNE